MISALLKALSLETSALEWPNDYELVDYLLE